MKTKIDILKWYLPAICLAVLLSVTMATAGTGFPAEWPEEWMVASEYRNPMTNKTGATTYWRYRLSPCSGENTCVSVSDRDERAGSRAEFTFDAHMRQIRAEWTQGMRGREIRQTLEFKPDVPAVLEESIIPGNWMNASVPGVGETREAEVRTQIGDGAGFVRKIVLSAEGINTAQAVGQGLIRETAAARLGELRLVLITCHAVSPDGGKTFLFSQLWAEPLSFWLFEETPTRRSTLVIDPAELK